MTETQTNQPDKTELRKRLFMAIVTGSTCGDACWHAEEDVCRCSCGGKNHGCLKNGNGKRPVRTARIDGERYELLATGTSAELGAEARRLLEEHGPRSVEILKADSCEGTKTITYTYWWRETEPGSPIRLRSASKSQIQTWPELQAWKDNPAQHPYLLWRQVPTTPEPNESAPEPSSVATATQTTTTAAAPTPTNAAQQLSLL